MPLRVKVHTGEPGAGIPAVRARIEEGSSAASTTVAVRGAFRADLGIRLEVAAVAATNAAAV